MAKLNTKGLMNALMHRGGGGLIGGAANATADKYLPATMKPILKTGIKVGVGAFLPEMFPKVKIADGAGTALVGAAVSDFLKENVGFFQSTPSTQGIGEDIDRGYVIDEDMAGTDNDNNPVINEGSDAGVTLE